MIKDGEIVKALERYEIGLRCKSDSFLMRIIGFVSRLLGRRYFLDYGWIRLGRTIYYPSSVEFPLDLAYYGVIESFILDIRDRYRV